MAPDLVLLERIDDYLDAVPRWVARTEELGPFTLFVNEGRGWRYYGRPTPGSTVFTPEDVRVLRERQRKLGQPEQIEWIEDLSTGVGPAAAAADLKVLTMPLMSLSEPAFQPVPAPADARVSLASPDDDLVAISSVAVVGFGSPGAQVGPDDSEAVSAAQRLADPDTMRLLRDRMERGITVTSVAYMDGVPVATASHQPLDGTTEIVGVATLPSFRRRGLGAAVTSQLVQDALGRGVQTVFLSAGDATIARVYERLGFRTVGRVGEAEPDPPVSEVRPA